MGEFLPKTYGANLGFKRCQLSVLAMFNHIYVFRDNIQGIYKKYIDDLQGQARVRVF